MFVFASVCVCVWGGGGGEEGGAKIILGKCQGEDNTASSHTHTERPPCKCCLNNIDHHTCTHIDNCLHVFNVDFLSLHQFPVNILSAL